MLIIKQIADQRKRLRKYAVSLVCFLVVSVLAFVTFWDTQNTFSASGTVPSRPLTLPVKISVTPPLPKVSPLNESAPTPAPPAPVQSATRIKIIVGEIQDLPFSTELISAVAVSPEIATVQIKNARLLTITGIKIGETILLLSDKVKRFTLMIQVVGKPSINERQNNQMGQPVNREQPHQTTGSYRLAYSAGFNENPSILRQNVEFQRKLSKDRTLRISSEIFKVIQADEINQSLTKAQAFGLNYLSIGLDSKDKTIDFLDNQINLSPLSFHGYTMRGFHYSASSKSSSGSNLPDPGLEIFAGLSRPSLAFYDNRQGRFAGALVPIAKGESWQIRAGFITVSAERNNQSKKGGTVFQAIGKFAPNDRFSAESELQYAHHKLSWRGRADLKLSQLSAFGEIIRLDQSSPLSSMGAQPAGNKAESLAFNWRPAPRFGISLTYHHSEIGRLQSSGLINFERTNFSVNTNFKINRDSNLILRFLDQKFESLLAGSSTKIQLENRSLTIGYNLRFKERWTNNFEARLNFSREAEAGTELEKGFDLKEQLRFSIAKSSITGFLNYTHKTPSLTSLIVRHPQLLPPVLQSALTLDVKQFLQAYQDRLAFLLPSLELPQTRNLNTGVSFQTSFSRLTVTSETRYTTGEIQSLNGKSLITSFGVSVRLDEANSVQINGWKSFGDNRQNAISVGYTHTFGAGSGNGFSFSKWLGFDRGQVKGRVYLDLNGNGQDDPDEPGVGGMTIQLNQQRSIKTDIYGRYSFSESAGNYKLAIVSQDLGVRFRATSATQKQISLVPGKTANVSFGVSNFGFVSGQALNDLTMTGNPGTSNLPGIKGLKMRLRSADPKSPSTTFETFTSENGVYEFRNLPPGEYILELDLNTLPSNFRSPKQTSWPIKVGPIQGFYFDFLLEAQRSVSGLVFIDKNKNGQFDVQIDQTVEGAIIQTDYQLGISNQNGSYMLRNLPAGKIKLFARSPKSSQSREIFLELGAEPVTRRDINFIVEH